MILTSSQFSASGGRANNDDCVEITQRENAFCFTLCDGLGGHSGGALASRCVCDAMQQAFLSADNSLPLAVCMEQAIVKSQSALMALQAQHAAQDGLRTTICSLMLSERDAAAAFVGDSRIYQFRKGRLLAHTHDHSVAQRLVQIGEIRQEDVRRHEDRNFLLRCLGMPWETPQLELWAQLSPLEDGDAFLLCSDGLWEWVLEVDMEQDLSTTKTPQAWIDAMCARLPGQSEATLDNYSAIAVFVQQA